MPEIQEAVVEFGPGDETARRPGRHLPVGEFVTRLAGDRRLVPLAAALGGVALFGSLVSEWQVTEIDGTAFGAVSVGARPLQTTVADLGGWGGGYLTGLLLLVTATVLTLFGPPAGRRYARLAALSTGGVLLAMVAAIGSYLGDNSRILGQLNATSLEPDQVSISVSRGVWCAGAGAVLVLVALVLAGRHLAAVPAPGTSAGPAEPDTEPEPAAWSWRRPETSADERQPEAPFGLTVSAAPPFTASQENRDKPSEGISG